MRKCPRVFWKNILGVLFVASVCSWVLHVDAAPLMENPNVSWAPDGQAYTTDAGEKFYTVYERGLTVYTGRTGSIQELQEGQHYYQAKRIGVVPIASWRVSHTPGKCVHPHTVDSEKGYHGLDMGYAYCHGMYKSGWIGVCADCNQEIRLLFYMDKETAESIEEISTAQEYYYLCPNCKNLEQGAEIIHECRAVSWNHYFIAYDGNGGKNYMLDSEFMYNNETMHDGEPITPETRLKKCAFRRAGYEFAGWNTEMDGSGQSFDEEQEIYNLTSEEGAKITLYAQWEKCESELYLDPNGGRFDGNYFLTCERGGYGQTVSVAASLVTAPEGYRISFVENGGSAVADKTTERYFAYWQRSNPFYGNLAEETYTFGNTNGAKDYLTAQYGDGSITLPSCSKEGAEFGGWYKDAECSIFAGNPGDEVVFTKDTVLYAQWVSLQLTATEDYGVNGGAGAVDLSWVQRDSFIKTYRLYQSHDNTNWNKLSFAGNGGMVAVTEAFAATGTEENYTVPYSGLYTLTVVGAQGEDYKDEATKASEEDAEGTAGGEDSVKHKGGKGGSVSATVWLSKGEILTYTVGSVEGYGGGGSGNPYGNGGGMTVITSNQKGLLLLAGGGGGASALQDGGAGGLAESLVADASTGENGDAGGGGGYLGGTAAVVEIHTHTEECFQIVKKEMNGAFYAASVRETERSAAWGASSGAAKNFAMAKGYAEPGTSSIGNPATATITTAKDSCVEIPGAGTLSFTVRNEWNQNVSTNPLPAVKVWIYDKDTDALLYAADLSKVPYTETEKRQYYFCDQGNGCTRPDLGHYFYFHTWHYENETLSGDRTWNPSATWIQHNQDANGNAMYGGYNSKDNYALDFRVPIPDTAKGVYLKVRTEVNCAGNIGAWYDLYLEDVTYTYTVNTCGYEEGAVLSDKKAFGGSNYVNEDYCNVLENLAGVQEGDGQFCLSLTEAEYLDNLVLEDVPAPDEAAPEAVDIGSIGKTALGGNRVKVVWDGPKDYGTDYYHRAESYNAMTGQKLCDSNVTVNHLVSGIRGYYYCIDGEADTVLSVTNGAFTENNALEITLTEDVQYLHLAAVDRAGNVSGTIHVMMGRKDPEVAWNILTGQVEITATKENVYAAPGEKTWYVRADGQTPFALHFSAGLDREALETYQVNYLEFDITAGGRTQRFQTYTSSRALSEGSFVSGIGEVTKSMGGELLLEDAAYTVTTRSNLCRDLSLTQHFTMEPDFDGQTLRVVPVAGAERGDKRAYSDWDKDVLNGISIIGDGTAPLVQGLEGLENLENMDWEADTISVELSCSDEGSGVRAFYVTVENQDNYIVKNFYPDADGHIRMDLADEEDYALAGDYILTVHAIDNVGNDAALTYQTAKFSLSASVTRMREPHEPMLQRGEYGILHIRTTGYVDKISVDVLHPIFPEGVVFTYAVPEHIRQEDIEFKVPLDATEGQYEIVVHAYKNGRQLDTVPVMGVFEVSGTILDDFRRKINWNSFDR